MNNPFPCQRLTSIDYLLAAALLVPCFLLFFHNDIAQIGWASLSYLYGNPLDFYDNAGEAWAKLHGNTGATSYPPTIYLIFALALYPFAALGVITGPEVFPMYLSLWLKVLTTAAYVASGAIFYRVCLQYAPNPHWAKFATAAWLTTPFALFTQFIFAQFDIIYVLLAIAGFLMFIRERLYWASLLFGVAITFKYFPAFTFIPLLLLYEKRFSGILINGAIFAAPTVLIQAIYGRSPEFVQDVNHHWTLTKLFASNIDTGGWQIYLLITSFAVITGMPFFADVRPDARPRAAAFTWLVSASLPFLFINWHPQWTLSIAPALALTSMLSRKQERFFLLDLVGMFVFVATCALNFPLDADAAGTFRGALFGLNFHGTTRMATFFDWFGSKASPSVFASLFVGYLLLQILLKSRSLLVDRVAVDELTVDYWHIRRRLWIGLLIFLIPASFTIYRDLTG